MFYRRALRQNKRGYKTCRAIRLSMINKGERGSCDSSLSEFLDVVAEQIKAALLLVLQGVF